MADLLRESVSKIVIETEWLPPIVIADPLGPPPPEGSPGARVGKLLKPRITLTTPFGPVVSKPWGNPVQNWPMLKALLLGFAGLGVVYGVLRFKKRLGVKPTALAPRAVHGLTTRKKKRSRR